MASHTQQTAPDSCSQSHACADAFPPKCIRCIERCGFAQTRIRKQVGAAVGLPSVVCEMTVAIRRIRYGKRPEWSLPES